MLYNLYQFLLYADNPLLKIPLGLGGMLLFLLGAKIFLKVGSTITSASGQGLMRGSYGTSNPRVDGVALGGCIALVGLTLTISVFVGANTLFGAIMGVDKTETPRQMEYFKTSR